MMKKAKPTSRNKSDNKAKKRAPASRGAFPLQLFFSFYTAKVH
jgi:hypothetical protein